MTTADGTNTVEAKRALVAALRRLHALTEAGPKVQVVYGWQRDIERECVVVGKATFTHAPWGGGSRVSRREAVEIALHIRVSLPGGTLEDAEARAQAIGAELETALAGDVTGSALATAGIKRVLVLGGDLGSDYDDDDAIAGLSYRVQLTSHLR